MACRPHAGLARGSAVHGGDAAAGSNCRLAAAGPAPSAFEWSRPFGGRPGRAIRSIGCACASSRRSAAGVGATESSLCPVRRSDPGLCAAAGVESSGVDQARPGRRRPADGGSRCTRPIRAARSRDRAADHVRGRRAARCLPRTRPPFARNGWAGGACPDSTEARAADASGTGGHFPSRCSSRLSS